MSNGSLHTAAGFLDPEAQTTVTLERDDLIGLLLDQAAVIANLKTEGDTTVLATLFSLLDRFESDFPIVTP
ncbi:alkyl sulfatase C-terminal domain-containing protein [Glycomyces rhizosphaerae]|uniref:Alkyl sulfatase C-terminal domain-containing protein n=1 Tax=Glycomyces rhizosphaerae TaxID=2054422 RepID=A0ABV7PZJ6_9ACTN